MKKKVLFDLTCLSEEYITGVANTALALLNEFVTLCQESSCLIEIFPGLPINRYKHKDRVLSRLPKYYQDKLIFIWPWFGQNFQIYHSPDSKILRFLNPSLKKTVMLHDLQSFHLNLWTNQKKALRMQKKLRENLNRKVDVLFTPSHFTASEVRKHQLNCNDMNIVSIYHGSEHLKLRHDEDVAYSHVFNQIKKPFFLCVGTIENRKNQLRLAQAFHEIYLKGHIGFMLVFAGGIGENGQQIKEEILKLKNPNIVFLGFTSNDDKTWLFENCKAVLYPSLYEGFGLPLIEAMVAGKPILTSFGGATEEVVTAGFTEATPPFAVLVNANDHKSILAGLEYLAVARFDRVDWSNHLKHFSWRISALKHIQIWESL